MSEDLVYYEKRMQQERQAAASARCDYTRRVHEKMADLYAKMVEVLGSAANDRE